MKRKIIDTPHKNQFNMMAIIPTLDTERERRTILSTVRKPEVVFGSFAFNKQQQYGIHQKRPFTDIDVKSPVAKESALQIEQKLDNMVNMNNYYISELEHDEGITYRVHSRGRGDYVVADVGKLTKRIPTRMIDNVPYETMEHREKEVAKLLKKKDAEYRRAKDRQMMGYIKRAKKSTSKLRMFRAYKPF